MGVIKFGVTCLVLSMSGVVLASIDVSKVAGQDDWLVITKQLDAELQLNVTQAPLANVLASIAHKTGVRMNYSVVPDDLVTATCAGSTVKQVLECLLAGKADIVFRYADTLSKTDAQPQIEEVWVVGEKSGKGQVTVKASSVTTIENSGTKSEPDQTAVLLKMTSSNTPAERVEAMGRLLAAGQKGDVAVKQVLTAGLADPDPLVRVRALSSLAHREGGDASGALHEALQDSNVAVRLTAVDNAGGDAALLQQALTDSDATVRQLAELRLKQLSKAGDQ